MRSAFYPSRILEAFPSGDCSITVSAGEKGKLRFSMEGYLYFRTFPDERDLRLFSREQLGIFYETLQRCVIEDKYSECIVLLEILRSTELREKKQIRGYEEHLIRTLKKIAHKKYFKEYSDIMKKINSRGLMYCGKELEKLREIAGRRFEG
jgi:hypothetical protein